METRDCTFTDLSGAQGAGSGLLPSAVVDPATGELFMVTLSASAEPALLFFQ